METSREIMAGILARHPELQPAGFGQLDAVRLVRERALMLNEENLAKFDAARAWLRPLRRTQHPRRLGDAHGTKHIAQHDIGHCGGGTFIAAAIAEGFKIRRSGHSAYLNISIWALREAEARADHTTAKMQRQLKQERQLADYSASISDMEAQKAHQSYANHLELKLKQRFKWGPSIVGSQGGF
jgi:hypothetical protein